MDIPGLFGRKTRHFHWVLFRRGNGACGPKPRGAFASCFYLLHFRRADVGGGEHLSTETMPDISALCPFGKPSLAVPCAVDMAPFSSVCPGSKIKHFTKQNIPCSFCLTNALCDDHWHVIGIRRCCAAPRRLPIVPMFATFPCQQLHVTATEQRC